MGIPHTTQDWQLSLLQPNYKGHSKDQTDPASYRGINLNDTLAKLFAGLLITRLTTHTEILNTLTDSQLMESGDYISPDFDPGNQTRCV